MKPSESIMENRYQNISHVHTHAGHNAAGVAVACREMDALQAASSFSAEAYMDATMAVLVLDGECILHVNRNAFAIRPDTVVLLSASHLFRFADISDGFRCRFLSVGEQFMRDMDATDMIYKRIKYGALLYNTPVMQLDTRAARVVRSRMQAVESAVANSGHAYYKELILNELNGFYLDLSDIIDRRLLPAAEVSTRHGSIVRSFIELLVRNYRHEHKVDFYASRLSISTHYLTLIVRRVTGRTPSELIFEMLYSHARTLLATSRLSIQEIAWTLHFSDQSSLGKFFKRRSGMTPHDYRVMRRVE